MRISNIIFIIGAILLFPALYTILTVFISILSFDYINLYELMDFDKIFRENDNLFFGLALWGIVLWIVSMAVKFGFEVEGGT